MINLISFEQDSLGYIVPYKLKSHGVQVSLDILLAACKQIIDRDYVMTLLHEDIA
jgi:hypothetical protein